MKNLNTLLSLLFVFISTLSFGQVDFNLELLSQNGEYAVGGQRYNDIWGYVAPDNTEYAIIGYTLGTVIYDLSDPSNPVEVKHIPNNYSVWRDYKTWGDYIYITADSGEPGLGIVNMAGAPDNITYEFWKPELTVDLRMGGVIVGQQTDTLLECHNIYIDTNGTAFLSGCNLNEGGVIMFDVATTPGTPLYLGSTSTTYSHDNFARGDTVWSADIYEGFFSATDVSDKQNPVILAQQTTSYNFTHNCWLSDDGNYLFTTDERANAYVDAFDVSDLTDIKKIDRYRPPATEGLDVIPHNTHYHDGYLITSWYTDGVKILDASKPDNLVEVGSFDTYKGLPGGFFGCWGAYPFLPSGILLASDRETGLYVLQPGYSRASYLEGTVTDALTSAALNDVRVEFSTDVTNLNRTDASGQYRTGHHQSGAVTVRFSKEGYERGYAEVNLIPGQVVMLDIALQPATPISVLQGVTISELDGGIVPGTQIYIENDLYSYEAVADANGLFSLENIFADTYQIYSGKWGYLQGPQETIIDGNSAVEVVLSKGYQDDFFFELNWDTLSEATTSAGFWERGQPLGTRYQGRQSHPDQDIKLDLGFSCYSTGNGGGGATTDDIDNGDVWLISPEMDLSDYDQPVLKHYLWFFNFGGTPPQDDFFKVWVTNGQDTVLVEELNTPAQSVWRDRSAINLKDYITITNTMKVIYHSGDQPGSGHVVEAAVDAFLIEDATMVDAPEVSKTEANIKAYPNPFANTMQLSFELNTQPQQARLLVYNILGQLQESITISGVEGTVEIGQGLVPGTYFLSLEMDGIRQNAGKIIKISNE